MGDDHMGIGMAEKYRILDCRIRIRPIRQGAKPDPVNWPAAAVKFDNLYGPGGRKLGARPLGVLRIGK